MRAKLYRYNALDIANAANVTESKVRRDIRSGRLVPSSLRSTAAYIIKLSLEEMHEQSRAYREAEHNAD